MNSSELVKSLAKKLQLSQTEINKRMDDVVTIITAELVKSNLISLSNFGLWETKKRDERVSVNPASGQRMLIPPRIVVKFKPANGLKEQLKTLDL
ncbi:MAG: DNA-binding protein HU [Candidatus Ordinivivax streblomastigis]|uniref:DNA-binding protein HU n=1 Tax=Candidatus Ordinivivax streblomastigis TaxID=2540710 RepID=A0A5M8P139_9BACT|nr:MAG: DNA-binding protein HU [Candidatus Ordinivivax streblomastigis]